jgi:muconolactone D-isomerase
MSKEFLVRIELTAPPDMDGGELARLRQQEAVRARELAGAGKIVRLWRASSAWGNWGLWRCENREALMELLDSLPLRRMMAIEVHDLGLHPSDPVNRNAPGDAKPHE